MAHLDSGQAFVERLEAQYHRQLFNRCMRIAEYDRRCTEMAEECVQDVLLAAHENREALKDHPNLLGWLYTACNYRMQMRLRQARRVWRREASIEDAGAWHLEDTGAAFQQRWHEKEDASSAAEHVLRTLNETDSALLRAHYLEGKPLKQIARDCGTSEGSVKVTLHRARKKAEKILKKHLNFIFFC